MDGCKLWAGMLVIFFVFFVFLMENLVKLVNLLVDGHIEERNHGHLRGPFGPCRSTGRYRPWC